jgi:hypothetical protein
MAVGCCHYLGMKTSSLEILEKSELPPAQAHAILKVLESEMSTAHETLATKTDLLALKSELKTDILNLRGEMHGIEGKLSRWVLACILGQTAVLAGLGYFFLSHLGR